MPLRQILLIAAIVVFAVGMGYWAYETDLKVSRQPAAATTEIKVPDFFSYNAHVREFDEKGQLKSDLTADSISHFPHNEITLLASPDLWSYSENAAPWHTVADTGRILPDGETVELKKNVVMTQMEGDTQKLRMDTDFLTIYSDQDFADTNRPVTIISPSGVMKANGMKAFYKRDFIQLKSRVRGVHESR
ncbi:MAG: LPS export ABC transporter periplasmic protein LptC [Oceanospirillales bacterium LUC14_002_19_P2]|nr:MAG: LPS export ABC transporter periplasmic protein LptC [Oceanospirillales bacterium LUC14_002_19_P2]